MKNHKFIRKTILAASLLVFLFSASEIKAISIGETTDFNVEPDYDSSARDRVTTVLIKTTPKLYFYVEKNWWDSQISTKQSEILSNLDALSLEFTNKIYPTLTSVFGSEWKPGVDGDERITIVFHSMKEDAGGYFRTADEYIKIQVPKSNEREMLYLPVVQIGDSKLKVLLAHELVHLITFNQKDKVFGVEEEVWLNEARADYSSTMLGYDDLYDGSNLQKRVQAFLEKPTDSLTEWQGKKYDYGVASIFTHYMVSHYSVNILIDSLKAKSVGIESINYALQKNGAGENFSQIFTNWTIATIINDCSLDRHYCYLDENLKNLKINPTINFLPLAGNSSLSVTNVTKNWSGNWQKIIGGNGDLKLAFSSLTGLNFKIPYIIYDSNNKYSVGFVKLNENQAGEVDISKFGTDNKSFIIMPSLQSKVSDFDGLEFTYPFTFVVSITGEASLEDQAIIKKLLEQIAFLKSEIAKLQGQPTQISCANLNNNLYAGINNSSEVKCLQEFLKQQGAAIYPEGLVTGNFAALTKSAVIRFQEKYSQDILQPFGLTSGTGFVGSSTRAKINQLLSN